MDHMQNVTNEDLTPLERDWLICEEVRRTIVSTSHDLFNYWPFPKSNATDVSARGPQAHLAIEKSLKFILAKACSKVDRTHDLENLLGELEQVQKDRAQFLETAFQEAREFYCINPEKEGLEHTKSLSSYLNETGNGAFFQLMRYWHIEQRTNQSMERIIKLIPVLHLELLHAIDVLHEIPDTQWTVNDRVDIAVTRETTERASSILAYNDDPNCPAKECFRFFRQHQARSAAMAEAIKGKFQVAGPEFNRFLEQSYQNLKSSTDPAVRYFIAKAAGEMECDLPTPPKKYKVSTTITDNLNAIAQT